MSAVKKVFNKGAVFVTGSPGETEELGEEFAATLGPGSVVALTGELGSGKTCFVRGVARGLGAAGKIKSPSFTIINVHEGGGVPFYHVDLYSLSAEGETATLGLDEYLYGYGVTVVEWAERAMDEMPASAAVLALTYVDEAERKIEVIREGRQR